MGPVIGDILPLALGVAISPIPIIAAILMLFSPRAAATSTGFLIGWVVGIVVATGIFTALAGSIGSGRRLVGLVRLDEDRARRAAAVGRAPAVPRAPRQERHAEVDVRDRLPDFGKALGLGFLLSAINPKNLLMAVAAGVAIGSAGLSVGSDVVVDRDLHGDRGVDGGGAGDRLPVARERMRGSARRDEGRGWRRTTRR